jgi:phage terminase small subunit
MAGKAAKPASKDRIGSMNDQMRAFAAEYTVDFSGKNAAIRAGYAEKSAAVTASRLLDRPDVQELLQQRMARIEAKTEINSERVIREAWGIATADVNELVEFRRRCCRHCYGIDFGYQRTVQEISRDRAKYNAERNKAIAKDPNCVGTYEDFDEMGGDGYDARKPPVADCTHCWGDGVGDALFKATGAVSPSARSLYAGVKQTKDGYQMLLVDKLGAMEKLMKHLGLYETDNKQKSDGFAEFMAAVAAKSGGKLPIKDQ